MRTDVMAVWWIACLLWSNTFLFIRVGVTEIHSFTLAWMRSAIALAVLTPIAIARHDLRTLRSIDVRHVASAGLLLLGANYSLLSGAPSSFLRGSWQYFSRERLFSRSLLHALPARSG
jgi:hypothetical protein